MSRTACPADARPRFCITPGCALAVPHLSETGMLACSAWFKHTKLCTSCFLLSTSWRTPLIPKAGPRRPRKVRSACACRRPRAGSAPPAWPLLRRHAQGELPSILDSICCCTLPRRTGTTHGACHAQAKNVVGGSLEPAGPNCGFYRDGYCFAGADDGGVHAVCAEVRKWSQRRGLRGHKLCSSPELEVNLARRLQLAHTALETSVLEC